MIICILVYILTFILTILFFKKRSKKSRGIKNIKVKKNGVEFISYCRQYICISNAKYILLDNQVFLRIGDKRLAIKNISNVEKIEDKLFFMCHGRVDILFDNREFYRYFNVIIYSDKINLKSMRHKAAMDIVYNPLNFVEKRNFSNFIKVIKSIFGLSFNQKKLIVNKNRYYLPFKMIYKLNGKIRKVDFKFS